MTTTPRPSADAADVLVLGAGPYGLSAYAHLRRLGVRARIFGDPMSTWRAHMPAGMYLKSTADASNINTGRPGHDLADYCRRLGTRPPTGHDPIPLELFNAYGMWFADTLAPDLEQTEVTAVEQDARGRFHVETGTGERFTVRDVVVASGLVEHAYVPPELAPLLPDPAAATSAASTAITPSPGTVPDAPVSHAADHTDLSVFAGQRVAVIGGGQCALETAALLAEAGAHPTVLVRGEKVVFGGSPYAPPAGGLLARIPKPQGPLGPGWSLTAVTKGPALFRRLPDTVRLAGVARILGPFGSWWLRERVEGVVPIRLGQKVLGAAADGDGVTLKLAGSDGVDGILYADHVISATGYRIGPDSFPFLDQSLRTRLDRVAGWPRLGPAFASNIPGLHFIGFPSAASFGPMMRFVCGTAYTSPHIAKALSAQ
jgi:thioredoxin reductase